MKKILFLLLFLINCMLVSGVYENIGGDDGNFYSASSTPGLFNADINLDDIEVTARSISAPTFTPIVADFNNDGTNEILVVDGEWFRLYQNDTLIPIANVNFGSGHTDWTTPYIIDIDEDGLLEIGIFIYTSPNTVSVEFYDYTGGSFSIEYIIPFTMSSKFSHGEMQMACESSSSPPRCLLLYTVGGKTDATANNFVYITGVNSTDWYGSWVAIDGYDTRSAFCLPKLKFIPVADYDNDGIDEFVTIHLRGDRTNPDYLEINWVRLGATLIPVIEHTAVINSDLENWITGSQQSCISTGASNGFSAPLLMDLDGVASNLELIIAHNKDADEFKVSAWDSAGSWIDRFPNVFDADGTIISNPIASDVMTDTGRNEFCVFGFEVDEQQLSLLCGGKASGLWGDDIFGIPLDNHEYKYSLTTETWNISTLNSSYAIVGHSTEQLISNDRDEFVSSYGIFVPDPDGVGSFGLYTLKKLYSNTQGDGALIPVDVANSTKTDLLLLTQYQIIYIDDGFENKRGFIKTYELDPCAIRQIAKVNETAILQVVVKDVDGDKVQANATMYYQDVNQQAKNWTELTSVNQGNNATFVFVFHLNETINNGKLQMNSRDAVNQEVHTIDLTFNVQNQGFEFGDCTDSDTYTDESEEGEDGFVDDVDLTTETKGNNTLTQGINYVSNYTGFGSTLIWIIVMLGFAIVIMKLNNIPDKDRVYFIILAEIFLLIIGKIINVISIGTLWVITILGGLATAVYLSNKFGKGD